MLDFRSQGDQGHGRRYLEEVAMGRRWARRNKARAVVAAGGLLAVTVALAPTTALGQQGAAPGDPELHNLEHVFNFDTEAHDTLDNPDAHRGTDLEFVTIKRRDYAVMGSSGRGAYIFDVTDPENVEFVTRVTCRQDRNDVGIKKFVDLVPAGSGSSWR